MAFELLLPSVLNSHHFICNTCIINSRHLQRLVESNLNRNIEISREIKEIHFGKLLKLIGSNRFLISFFACKFYASEITFENWQIILKRIGINRSFKPWLIIGLFRLLFDRLPIGFCLQIVCCDD